MRSLDDDPDPYVAALLERARYVHPAYQGRPSRAAREQSGRHERRISLVAPIGWVVDVDEVAARLDQSRSMVIRGAVAYGLKAYLAAGGVAPEEASPPAAADRPVTGAGGKVIDPEERIPVQTGGDPGVTAPPARPRGGQ